MAVERIQIVEITLSDGRVGLFSGPELVTEKDTQLTVVGVQFREGANLNKDCRLISFEEMVDREYSGAKD